MTKDPAKRRAQYERNYARHKEQILAKNKRWHDLNREKHNAMNRKWRLEHPETFARYSKAYRDRNPERSKTIQERYKKAHPEALKRTAKKWYENNYDKVVSIVYRRKARKQNCKTDSTAETFYAFVRSRKTIPCYYCGNPVSGKKAHIDHIMAISRSGNHSSENLCASCPTCNLSKGAKLLSEWKREGQQLLQL